MKYRRLGTSGLKVSEVSLGSWLTLGGTVGASEAQAMVRRALDLGINLLDTADVYSAGEAERVLGACLEGVPRSSVVLATKCYFPVGEGPNDRGLSRKHVVESLHGSLRRLKTDYVDIYQCHRFDEETPVEEVVRAMDDLARQGKLLYWGVSHWPAHRITEAAQTSRRLLAHPPASNQPPYSMLERTIEEQVMPACRQEGMGLIVFSPLAQGVLTGKYDSPSSPPSGSRAAHERNRRFISRFLTQENLERVARLSTVASSLGVGLAELALAWCLRRPEVASVIVGASSLDQLGQNARASGLVIPAQALERIEEILT